VTHLYLFDLKQTKSFVQALNLPFVNNTTVSYCELNPEERKSRDTQDILFAKGLPVFTRQLSSCRSRIHTRLGLFKD
jgi:hypothetical protein